MNILYRRIAFEKMENEVENENVISSFRHYVIMTFANWTPPWDKWIVAMFSEWMSWMKNSDHRAPYPPLPTFQVSSIGSVADDGMARWVLMTKWRNDEMTFSISDSGEKIFKEIVYINIFIYTISLTRIPVFKNVISSFRHYVITRLHHWCVSV